MLDDHVLGSEARGRAAPAAVPWLALVRLLVRFGSR